MYIRVRLTDSAIESTWNPPIVLTAQLAKCILLHALLVSSCARTNKNFRQLFNKLSITVKNRFRTVRLKILKKLRTGSPNFRFSGSYKKKCIV